MFKLYHQKSEKPVAEGKFLILQLRRKLMISVRNEVSDSMVEIEGVKYQDVFKSHFAGFYDWLTRSDGYIIGVRYCEMLDPGKGQELMHKAFKKLEYIIDEGIIFEIYFSSLRDYLDVYSGHQDFTYNKVYLSDAGDYLMTFVAGAFSIDKKDPDACLKLILADDVEVVP